MAKAKEQEQRKWTKASLEGHIKELKPHLEKKFAERNRRIQAVYEHRMMTNTIWIPEAAPHIVQSPYHSDLTFDYLRRVGAIFGHEPPHAKREPSRPGEQAQQESSLVESWWAGLIHVLTMQNDITPLLYDALPASGGAVWKVLLKRDSWLKNIPTQNEGEGFDTYSRRASTHRKEHLINPFAWDYIPTETFYPYEVNGLCLEAMEICERDAYEIANKYNLGLTGEGKLSRLGDRSAAMEAGQTCKFIEWFDKNYYAYLIDDEIVQWDEHGYGDVPYFYAPAAANASRKPEDQWLSFAWPLISIQNDLETVTNMRKNWGYLAAYPITVQEPISSEFIGKYPENYKLILKLGEGVVPLPGHRLIFMTPPATGAELQSYHQILLEQAQTLALAPILQGMSPGAGTAGVTAAMMLTVAKSMFEPAADNFARAWDKMAEFVLRIVDTILVDPVPIWFNGKEWLELSSKEIHGFYQIHHSLKPVIPAEQQLILNQTIQAYGVGAATLKEVVEARGISDPERIIKERTAEDIGKMPQLLNLVMQKVLEGIGLAEPVQAQGTPAGMGGAPSGFGTIPLGQPEGPGAPMEQIMP